MRFVLVNILFLLFIAPEIPAQSIGTYLGNEEILNAQTKQVNQFFRRFNCEESTEGKRFYPGDSLYRNPDLREKYLNILFGHIFVNKLVSGTCFKTLVYCNYANILHPLSHELDFMNLIHVFKDPDFVIIQGHQAFEVFSDAVIFNII